MTGQWWSLDKAGNQICDHDFHLGKVAKGKRIVKEILRDVPHRAVMLDVGAHIGYFAEAGTAHFDVVHCFEPAPDCFDVLTKNLARHRNVVLHNVAVGPGAGRCTIHDDPDRPYSPASRFVTPDEDGTVPMVALDDLSINGSGLLKIDVEGFEHQVLVGAERYIEAWRPTIFMETHNKVWAQAHPYKETHSEAQTWLLRRGYRIAKRLQHDTLFVPV